MGSKSWPSSTVVLFLVFILCAFTVVLMSAELWECSESVCGPRVSKCMLIKSCNCSMTPDDLKSKNCTCCKDCVQCLGDFFTDCCSCVGLCRPPKDLDPRLAMKSFVEELEADDDQRALFELLTSDPVGPESRWTVETFPALNDPFFYKSRTEDQDKSLDAWKDVNCTVAYLNQCLSMEKCRKACESMGSSSYRWFHTGCCECVGDDCLNYGSREGKCIECGELEELDFKKDASRKEL